MVVSYILTIHMYLPTLLSVSGGYTVNWNLSSANCWAGILKNEKPIAECVSFYFLMLHLLFFFFFCFFFSRDTQWGWYPGGYHRKYGEKQFGWSFEVLKEMGEIVYG
jgi:hypothetical protein